MTPNKTNLALDEDDEDFILRRANDDGTSSEIRLSADDVLTLSQSAANLRQRILAKRTPAAGGVTPVFATNVARFGLAPDTLGEDVLLTLIAQNDSQTVFALSPDIARLLAERLPHHIAHVANAKLSKQ